MNQRAEKTTVDIIPTLRYRDVAAAIQWLCTAFGFERHLVMPSDDGGVAHAQLVFGNGMIMLGSARGLSCPQQTKTTAGGSIAVGIRRAISGTSAVMTPWESK